MAAIPRRILLLIPLALAAPAQAQFQLQWYTVDGGGGRSTGGLFELVGAIGQHDAGTLAAGPAVCAGGFWAGAGAPLACYANCDGSTISPVLNVQDFTCFLQRYAAGETYANCDGSTVAPVLNVQDFTCFLQTLSPWRPCWRASFSSGRLGVPQLLGAGQPELAAAGMRTRAWPLFLCRV